MSRSGEIEPAQTSAIALPDSAAIAEESEEAVALALERLTETQRRRLLARLGGATLQQIGDAEGVSTSAVDQTLKMPSVRAVMHSLVIHKVKDGVKERLDPIIFMVQTIMDIAAHATRSVVVGHGGGVTSIKQVPDYGTRLAAATKFLSLIDAPGTPQRAAPAAHPARPSTPSVELEQEETTSTRRRVRLSQP